MPEMTSPSVRNFPPVAEEEDEGAPLRFNIGMGTLMGTEKSVRAEPIAPGE